MASCCVCIRRYFIFFFTSGLTSYITLFDTSSLFVFIIFTWIWVSGATFSVGKPKCPLPGHFHQLFMEVAKVFPSQPRNVMGLPQGFYQLDQTETPPWGKLDAEGQWLYSEPLPEYLNLSPYLKGLAHPPRRWNSFWLLLFTISLFFFLSSDGWNVDWLITWELHLLAQFFLDYNGPVWSLPFCRCYPVPLIKHFSLTHEQDPTWSW